MSKPAWSWADYERCKRAEQRRRAKAAAIAIESVTAQEEPTADDASGCKGRAAEVVSGPAPAREVVSPRPHVAVKARQSRIDISAAPSGMEAAAERWKGKGPAPMELAPVPELCAGYVLCRCGSRASGKGRGPVPYWFGDKCIETNCELRGKA